MKLLRLDLTHMLGCLEYASVCGVLAEVVLLYCARVPHTLVGGSG